MIWTRLVVSLLFFIGMNSPLESLEGPKEIKSVNTHQYPLEPPEAIRRPIEEVFEEIESLQTQVSNEEVQPVDLIEPVPEHNVCDPDANFASWMDYRTITNTASTQYQLQTTAETTGEGLRQVNGLTLIAINSRYGAVGDVLKITFEDGHIEDFMIGDIKAHTDGCSQLGGNGRNSIIEIIVDSNLIDTRPGEILKYSKKLVSIR